jgi:hypothetical protein
MGRISISCGRPFRNGRAARLSHGYAPAFDHPASICSAATVFFALWIMSITCFGPPTRVLRSSRMPNESTLDNPDGSAAPLEASARPAFAIVRRDGNSPEGFQPRMESHRTARRGMRFLRVCAQAPGLFIFSRDLIGCETMYPFVTSQQLYVLIESQINGGYDWRTIAKADTNSQSLRIERPLPAPQTKNGTYRIRARRSHRSIVDFSVNRCFFAATILGRSPPPYLAEAQDSCPNNPQTRAPPRPFPQQMS